MGKPWNSTLERKTPLRRKSRLDRSSRLNPRNDERRDREWKRAYGSEERVKWVKRQPCEVCGETPSDNAHLPGAGGMGYKGDADTVLPLCRAHHQELHETGAETFEATYDVDLRAAAERVEERWQERQEEAT